MNPEEGNVKMGLGGGSSSARNEEREIDADLLTQGTQLLHTYCQLHDISMLKYEHMDVTLEADQELAQVHSGRSTVRSIVAPRLNERQKGTRVFKTTGTMPLPYGAQIKDVTVIAYATSKKDGQRLVSAGFLQEAFGDKVGSGRSEALYI